MWKAFALSVSVAMSVLGSTELRATAITVTGTGDTIAVDALCTLREALTAANTDAASGDCPAGSADDTIGFAIPGAGVHTISPLSALPSLTDDNIAIDGTTQPGFTGLPLIELNGSGAGADTNGLLIVADNATVRGLAINRFTASGIAVSGSTSGATIQGNFLGTDPTGTLDRGNAVHGLSVGGASNQIGGTAADTSNLISGNQACGIHLVGNQSDGNTVEGNFIGTNLAGTLAIPNACGIVVNNGADDNRLGGAAAGQANLISGNDGNGVDIGAGVAGTDGNAVQGNIIGTDGSGVNALPNTGYGVLVREDANGNSIGGIGAGEGNLIAFNQRGIVLLPAAANGTGILGNSIHSNIGLGIDLGDDGVTANDAGDGDSGPNALQNFPILGLVSSDGSNVILEGALHSQGGTDFRIEFFANAACDDSGNGEGQVLVGSVDVQTDLAGDADFSASFPIPAGSFFTATATNLATDDSSEFSPCFEIQGAPTPSPTPIPTPLPSPSPSASPSVETDCADAEDGDGDGLTDCADPDCAGDVACFSAELSGGGCILGQGPSSFGFWLGLLPFGWIVLRCRAR